MALPVPIRQSVLVFASLVCAISSAFATAPANDNFSGRLTLNDSVVSSGTNVDATLEAGTEPIPSGYTAASYQATVWWQWKPATPNPTQWYEVNTVGSAIDTVLSIWTGADYTTPLALVHVNDQAVNDDGTRSSVSRIRFLASNSTTYKIAVASSTAARGSINLLALPIPAPFSVVTEPTSPFFFAPITFSPSPANVATQVAMTVDIRLSSSKEITSGLLTLYSPTYGVLATASVSGAANRISGSVANGLYRMILNIPQGSPVGSCRWGLVVTNPGSTPPATSVSSAFGWEGLIPPSASAATSVTLINDSYAAWLTAYGMSGADSLRDADYDKDGVKNLVEFGFGADPLSGMHRQMLASESTLTRTGLPVITTQGTGDQTRLRIEFVRRLNDSSVTYTVQFSDDLVNWTDAVNAPSVFATSLSHEAVAVEDSIFLPAKTLRFGRVRVVQ